MSLKVKTARNSLVMGAVTVVLRPLDLIVSVILARLLDPGDFGLVSLAMVLVTTSNLFTGLGMAQAVIHSQEERRKIASHGFVLVMVAGLLFFLLVQAASLPLAGFLGDERTAPILRALSYMILVQALGLIPLSLLRKELQFERVAISAVLADLFSSAMVLTLAWLGYGLWSIVYASVLKTLVNSVLYWLFCPDWDWLKPLPWDWQAARNLWQYGFKTMSNGLLSYFHTHWDDWLVGRMLGAQALGFYSQGYNFSNSTISNLSRNVISNVFFPSYAKIQQDKERLAKAYLKSVNLVLLVTTPMALGLLLIAHEIVTVVLGAKWLPMVPALQIFSFMILTRPISENSAPLFQAVGLPGYNVRAGFVLLAVMMPLAFLLLNQGIAGVAIAVAVSHFVGMAYNVYQMNTILPGTAKQTFKRAVPVLVAGASMMLAVQLVKMVLIAQIGGVAHWGALSILIGTGAVAYLAVVVLTQRALVQEVFGTTVAALSFKRRTGRKGLVSASAPEP